MKISVIFPTINREDVLLDSIDYILAQDLKELEIIVVDQTPDSQLPRLLEKYDAKLVKYIFQEEPSASMARNNGAKVSKAKVLLFLDDDVIIEDTSFLDKHFENYNDPKVCAVAGQVLSKEKLLDSEFNEQVLDQPNGWIRFPYNFTRRVDRNDLYAPIGRSCNFSVRRDVFLKYGGYDAAFQKGAHREESDLTFRMSKDKLKIVFDPKASLIHIAEPTGGIRNWNNDDFLALHHIEGEFYFILKHIELKDLAPHIYMALRRQVLTKQNVFNPWRLPKAIKNSCKGFIGALNMKRKGSVYIESLRD